MIDIEAYRRRARHKLEFAERVLADRRTRPWVRMMAERVREQINFILSENDPERIKDVSYYLANDFSVMWGRGSAKHACGDHHPRGRGHSRTAVQRASPEAVVPECMSGPDRNRTFAACGPEVGVADKADADDVGLIDRS